MEKFAEAVDSYDRAIAIKPDYADAYYNRGIALEKLGHYEAAVDSYDRAIAVNPGNAVVYNNRGNALKQLKQHDDALASYDRAISLNPDFADAYSNRGIVLKDMKQYREALASIDSAIALKPNLAEAQYNRGLVFLELKQYAEALASYDRAINLEPNYAKAYLGKALLKMLNADFAEGWRLYEWRWKNEPLINTARSFSQPLWLGEQAIEGKTLLIYPEQGFGDFIHFCRYLSLLETLGAKVILEIPADLLSLVSTLKGNFTMVKLGRPLPDFDLRCPIMSLPLAFKTTVADIPAAVPYLYADSEKQRIWHDRLGNKTMPRIGLAWSGSRGHVNDHNRSIALKLLEPLLRLPLEFHALQKEIRSEDEEALRHFQRLRLHRDDLVDFADTAALLDAMDLLISVDTSVAHLAGAMAKPVWILLPHAPDFRWMLDRTDCPWYPTATLFRQPDNSNWLSTLSEVAESLEKTLITSSF